MDTVSTTLKAFGESLKLENLTFNEHQVANFDIETMGNLYLESVDEGREALIYLVREVGFASQGVYQKALSLSHVAERNPFVVYVALRGEKDLIFAIRLTAEECDIPHLEQALTHLRQLHDRMMNT